MRCPTCFPAAARGQRARRHSRQRGFTLTELMVALSAGLFLCIVVFALSRDVTRFYQRETRIAGATLAGVSGMERLAGDLALAGHLTTPNIATDPHVCNRPPAGGPAALVNLRALTVVSTDATAIATTELGPDGANITPQTVTIAGAISVPEVFTTSTVAPGASGAWQINLDLGTASARRVGLSALPAAAANNKKVMTSLFLNGNGDRIIRLRKGGWDYYVVAADVDTAPGQAWIVVSNGTQLPRVAAGGTQCGIQGFGEAMAVSAINVVRYEIRSMTADPAYQSLFKASGLGKVPWEAGRAELVRVELDANGAEIASTREIVAEYAVNLQFNVWRATNAITPAPIAADDGVLNAGYGFIQLMRGVHVMLNVRSREPDREQDVYGAPAGALYRIPLGKGKKPPYARVRTLQSDVALRNMENSNW